MTTSHRCLQLMIALEPRMANLEGKGRSLSSGEIVTMEQLCADIDKHGLHEDPIKVDLDKTKAAWTKLFRKVTDKKAHT